MKIRTKVIAKKFFLSPKKKNSGQRKTWSCFFQDLSSYQPTETWNLNLMKIFLNYWNFFSVKEHH